jgi:hypothetical protein
MIALTILSIILVIGSVIMIQIGALYSKGINSANLQNVTRTLASDISSTLQFSNVSPLICSGPQATPAPPTCPASVNTTDFIVNGTPVPIYAICIGNTRYSYVMNRELGTDPFAPGGSTTTNHVLWRDTINQSSTCPPLDISKPTVVADSISADATQGNPSGGYEMMGDHMRLTIFNIPPPATSTPNIYNVYIETAYGDSDLLLANPAAPGQYNCTGVSGSQFCATSQTNTVITRRLQ